MNGAKQWLTLAALLLWCLGFEWPGRAARLSQQLRSDDVNVRREAARLLAEHTVEDARAPLLVALDDDDAGVRQAAIASAAAIGLRDHVPVLIDWLNDPTVETRIAAADALGVLREARAEAGLTRALGDSDARVRVAATQALGRIGAPSAIPALLGRLDDADPSVRLAAVRALAVLRDIRALIPLSARTQDTTPEVKVAALEALGALGDARALPPLLRSLDDEQAEVRLAAIGALGKLGHPSALEPLRARLQGVDARTGRALLSALAALATDDALATIAEQLGRAELSRSAVEVIVERVRRVRVLDPDAARRVLSLLTRRLEAGAPSAQATAVEEALIACSSYMPTADAVPDLLRRLDSQQGVLPVTALALGSTRDERALVPLLQRMDSANPDEQLALLRALDVLTGALAPDGRVADPLLAALNQAHPESTVLAVRILGRTHATRALTSLHALLDHARIDNRLAAIEALGEIGASESTAFLLPLLDDTSTRIRQAATRALGRTLDAAQVQALLAGLDGQTDAHRLARVDASVRAISREPSPLADDAARTALTATLVSLLADSDEAISALALRGLGALATPNAADAIAAELRSSDVARRRQAAAMLGNFDDARVRQVLRYVLTHDQLDVAVNAAVALARYGEPEDAAALAKLAQRMHWPFPAAASYSVAVIARRGLLKPLASHDMLCALGRSREPIVRANVAVAMAQLGSGACENGPDPIAWLSPEHASIVRAAAARWLYAAVHAGRVEPDKGRALLSQCASGDADAAVAEACAAPTLPPLADAVHESVTDADRRYTFRKRLFAMQLADASVFVGYSDGYGAVHAALTPGTNATVLDPGLLPLEPGSSAAPSAADAPRPAEPGPATP